MVVIDTLSRRVDRLAPAPRKVKAPGETEIGAIVLPAKQEGDSPRAGCIVVTSSTFSFTRELAGEELRRAVKLAAKGEGAAVAALGVWAIERGGLPAAVRLAWRKAGQETTLTLAGVLAAHAEEIRAQVVTERRAARKHRKLARPGIPVLVGVVVDAAPLLPAGPPLALLGPAPEDTERNSVETLPPGWCRVTHRIPRGSEVERWRCDSLLHPSAGCPRPW